MANTAKSLLKTACERCEHYGGTAHDYTECYPPCPVYELYLRLIDTQKKLKQANEQLIHAKEEQYNREQNDRGYWGIFG